MKTVKIKAKKWIPALAVIPGMILFAACEPRDDDPMVTDPDQEQETEWGQPDRDTGATPEEAPPPPEDPAMEQDPEEQQPEDPAY